jgi:prepilin-type N-terminal cleavage/methylation domain-containing protein
MRKGLTLVEILVALGIISILIGASVAGYSRMTRAADKTRCQELVNNTAVALTQYFNRNGSWPKVLITEAQGEKVLTAIAAYPISKDGGGSMSLTTAGGKLSGLDRLGIVDHWAMEVVKRRGNEASESDAVPTGGSVRDHTLRFAIDFDGDGIIRDVEIGGEMINIRATAAVWSCGRDGKIGSYSKNSRHDDVYSWTQGQTRNIE